MVLIPCVSSEYTQVVLIDPLSLQDIRLRYLEPLNLILQIEADLLLPSSHRDLALGTDGAVALKLVRVRHLSVQEINVVLEQ